jgi:hypothetical protein
LGGSSSSLPVLSVRLISRTCACLADHIYLLVDDWLVTGRCPIDRSAAAACCCL